jgi:hypothetical protein
MDLLILPLPSGIGERHFGVTAAIVAILSMDFLQCWQSVVAGQRLTTMGRGETDLD